MKFNTRQQALVYMKCQGEHFESIHQIVKTSYTNEAGEVVECYALQLTPKKGVKP